MGGRLLEEYIIELIKLKVSGEGIDVEYFVVSGLNVSIFHVSLVR